MPGGAPKPGSAGGMGGSGMPGGGKAPAGVDIAPRRAVRLQELMVMQVDG
jgi:hypothetical protein